VATSKLQKELKSAQKIRNSFAKSHINTGAVIRVGEPVETITVCTMHKCKKDDNNNNSQR